MWGDPIFLRAIERIFGVVIGGLAIWCGYRLFLAIPDQRGDGRAELALAKDKRLLITRIGPGTFFALFGTAVVLASYYFEVSAPGYSGVGRRPDVTAVTATATGPLRPLPLSTEAIRQSLAFLTDMEMKLAVDAGESEREWQSRRFRAAKLQIMARGWQQEWGDPSEFEIWLDEGPQRTPRPEFDRALIVLEAKE